MGIVYPSATIARRWDGALQARLKRVPLEVFLRARGLIPAPLGPSQDTDNLVRATVALIEAGLAHHFLDRADGPAVAEREVIAHTAFITCRSLGQLISRPNDWKIPALVSTARLLSSWMTLNEAAQISAAYARRFQRRQPAESHSDMRLAQLARSAVETGSLSGMADFSLILAADLAAVLSSNSKLLVLVPVHAG